MRPMHAGRRAGARRLPRPAVTREHLPPLLLAQAARSRRPSSRHFTDVDFVDRAALVVESHGEFIAWASYERWPGRDDADTAFMVDDAHQGKGIATLLLEHLAAIASVERHRALHGRGARRQPADAHACSPAPGGRRAALRSGVIEVDFPLADDRTSTSTRSSGASSAPTAGRWRGCSCRARSPSSGQRPSTTVGRRSLWRNIAAAPPTCRCTRSTRTARRSASTDGLRPGGDSPPSPTTCGWRSSPCPPPRSTAMHRRLHRRPRVAAPSIVTSVDGRGQPTIDVDDLVARARRNGVRIIGPSSMGVASSRRESASTPRSCRCELSPGSVAISMQSGSLGASVLRLAQQPRHGPVVVRVARRPLRRVGQRPLQFWDDDESTTTSSRCTPRRSATRTLRPHRPTGLAATADRRGAHRAPPPSARPAARCTSTPGSSRCRRVTAMLDTARVLADAAAPARPTRRRSCPTREARPALAAAALDAAGLQVADGAGHPRLDRHAGGLPHGDRRGARVRRRRRRARHPRPADRMMPSARRWTPSTRRPAARPNRWWPCCSEPVDGPIRARLEGAGVLVPRARRGGARALLRVRPMARQRGSGAAGRPPRRRRRRGERRCSPPPRCATAFVSTPSRPRRTRAYGIAVPAHRLVVADDAVAGRRRGRLPGRGEGAAPSRRPLAPGRRRPRPRRPRFGRRSGRGRCTGCSARTPSDVVVQSMTAPGLDLRVRVTVDPELGPLVAVGLGGRSADLLADEARRLAPLSQQSAAALVAGSRAGAAARRGRPRRPTPRRRRAARRPSRRRASARHRHRPQPRHRHRRRCVVTDAVVDVGPGEHVDVAPRAL